MADGGAIPVAKMLNRSWKLASSDDFKTVYIGKDHNEEQRMEIRELKRKKTKCGWKRRKTSFIGVKDMRIIKWYRKSESQVEVQETGRVN